MKRRQYTEYISNKRYPKTVNKDFAFCNIFYEAATALEAVMPNAYLLTDGLT